MSNELKTFNNDKDYKSEATTLAHLAREAHSSSDKITASNNLWSELQLIRPEDLAKIQKIINNDEKDMSCKLVTRSDNSGKPSEIIFGPAYGGAMVSEEPIAFKYKDGSGWQAEKFTDSQSSYNKDMEALQQKNRDTGVTQNVAQTLSDGQMILKHAMDALKKKK